ncbi:hypothetical protein GGD38_006875 [Chitinophagaceae bacterium OAS944]|nr:hypothetical protein [Chitinophagaceae bacterium OAS944]
MFYTSIMTEANRIGQAAQNIFKFFLEGTGAGGKKLRAGPSLRVTRPLIFNG